MKNLIFIFTLIISSHLFAINLKVKGNERTHKSVIKIEIKDLISKKDLSVRDLKEIKRRLWNLRIFSDIKIKKFKNTLLVTVKERWTTIPIAKFTGGGGSSYYALGVYDINSFGSNTELGAQYESLNSRPAGVLWYRKPQFLKNRKLNFGIDLWSINRVRFFFTRDGEDNGAFTLRRKRYNAFLEYRWDNDFYTFGGSYDYHIDEISDVGLTDEQNEDNQQNGFTPSGNSINRWQSLYFKIGRINFKNYLLDGSQLFLRSSAVSTDDEILSETELKFNYYHLFENNHNFAWQFRLVGNNLNSLQYNQYLGGLSEVRGYRDGQFFDQTAWQNNIEYRFDIFENNLGVIQAAVFSDQAKEGKTLDKLLESKDEILLSSGVGVRFISPKIFRFVGRLDYAQTHTRSVDRGISFGIQQFF